MVLPEGEIAETTNMPSAAQAAGASSAGTAGAVGIGATSRGSAGGAGAGAAGSDAGVVGGAGSAGAGIIGYAGVGASGAAADVGSSGSGAAASVGSGAGAGATDHVSAKSGIASASGTGAVASAACTAAVADATAASITNPTVASATNEPLAPQKPWVLITGATGGLGSEFAHQLAQCGEYNLALVARNAEKLQALAATLQAPAQGHNQAQAKGCQVQCFTADFSQAGATAQLVAQLGAAHISPELLINNAGFGYDAAFVKSDLTRQQALVQTNCEALMELCHAFAPAMVARGHGSIVNVASVAGFLPGPYMATYYASKAFVQSLTAALHVELAPRGIHVTALCPGPVKTPFWDNADAGHTALAHMCIAPPRVVRAGLRAVGRNATYCAPGVMAKFIVLCGRLFPRTSSRVVVALQKPEQPTR